MSEPARELQQVDVRVGSTANALQPISSAERSLAAGPAQWLALVVVAAAAIFADQLTKQLVGRTLEVGESVELVGPFSIHHVENSGIAFGLFASRTSFVIVITAVAVALMVWFFARSGRRHPVLPVGLGSCPRREHRQPGRPRAPRACDGLPGSRRVAGVQPRRHVHRRRGRRALRHACPRRPDGSDAWGARWGHCASASLRRTRAHVSTRCSRGARRSEHALWRRDCSARGWCGSTERPDRRASGSNRARSWRPIFPKPLPGSWRSRCRFPWSTRTSTSSCSTSRPGWSCTPARARERGRLRVSSSRSVRPEGPIPSVRASCTGSTATRRASWSWPARRRRTRHCRRRSGGASSSAATSRSSAAAPRSRTGRIDAPLGRDRRDPTKRSLDTEEPREAITHFEAIELMSEHALLDVRLETGRTHQIRVHLAAIDLPVSGDSQYGVRGDLELERQFLHAHRLGFRHPFTGEEIDVDLAAPARSGECAGASAAVVGAGPARHPTGTIGSVLRPSIRRFSRRGGAVL